MMLTPYFCTGSASVADPGFLGAGSRVGNPKDGSANLLFWPFYSENCVKLKKKMD